jgi:phosphoglycerol transferase MdoB-like AlkP superfamily enzyme
LGTGLKVQEQWPESDLEMIQLTTPEFIGTSPWHVYYMTVSGHKNYNWNGNNMARKHRDKVADLDMSENCKAYVACNIELDLAMEWLIQALDEAGELSNTVFAISGDHYPYGLTHEEIGEFLGHPVEPDFELYQSTFILWTPDMEPERVDKICSTLDIIPTLSNLFGLEYDSRLLAGRDIFSDASPLVMFANRSWITEEGRYNARTGVSEAFDQDGNRKEPVEALSQGYMDYVNGLVANRFYVSRLILEEDYYRHVIPVWEAPVR